MASRAQEEMQRLRPVIERYAGTLKRARFHHDQVSHMAQAAETLRRSHLFDLTPAMRDSLMAGRPLSNLVNQSQFLHGLADIADRNRESLARVLGAFNALGVAAGEQIALTLSRLRTSVTSALEPIRRVARDATRPGTFLGDWLRVSDNELSSGEREEALQRLAENWYSRPLHPRRWSIVLAALRTRAEEQGSSLEQELRLATMQALPLVFDDMSGELSIGEMHRRSRSVLANYLMDDLADPGWRRRSRASELSLEDAGVESVPDELDTAYEAEVALLQEAFLREVADLPSAQQRAIVARLEGKPLTNSEHQALHRLRRSPETMARLASLL